MIFFAWVIIMIILIAHSYKKSQKQKASYQKEKEHSNRPPASSSPTYRKRTEKPKEDVLTRAKKNVAEDFDTPPAPVSSVSKTKERLLNKYREPLKPATREVPQTDIPLTPEQLSFGPDIEASDAGNLMKTVQDLIVKGYEPKLSFERDFISESMDLLNKYYETEK